MSFWKQGRDTLANGSLLGGIAGALVVWGDKVYDWMVPLIPDAWTSFGGDYSIPIIVIGVGALVGYLIDRF